MTKVKDLLIEIGTEELPPKALKHLSAAFRDGIRSGLQEQQLQFGDIHLYASPRRLALVIKDLSDSQEDKETQKRGPALQAAFDDEGQPTRAASGFANSCGVSVEHLDTLETEKGSWLIYNLMEKGQKTAELLPEIIHHSLQKLPIPKRMRWGSSDISFVRPVHWIVLLFGDDVIETEIMGIPASNETRGHRFHYPETIKINSPGDYADQLEKTGQVIASFDQRRTIIQNQIETIASDLNGSAVIDTALLDEVTALVEWPCALSGKFDTEFLELPPEVLVSTMKGHQKYFHLVDSENNLLPYFITVSNIDSHRPEVVQQGNERVIRPRLRDSAHFWKNDLNATFSDWQAMLEKIIFQDKLGSVADKSRRVSQLAAIIATQIQGNKDWATRASLIAKCDLVSEMVGEFPDLQGIMGRYYAHHQNEADEVAMAINEQYLPRFSGDNLPTTKTGQSVSIAEKLDTLTGIFGIGQPPTGVKDPFALRRAALGCLRILIESKLDLDLQELLQNATDNFAPNLMADDVTSQVFAYMLERLRSYYQEQNIKPDTFEAVHSRRPTRPYDFDCRIRAVNSFRILPEAESLAAANKRIANILKKNDQQLASSVDQSLFEETSEKALFSTLENVQETIKPLLCENDYEGALKAMAVLKMPVDSFFDEVMVMCDDSVIRNNRLVLLNNLRNLFLQVADISKLQS